MESNSGLVFAVDGEVISMISSGKPQLGASPAGDMITQESRSMHRIVQDKSGLVSKFFFRIHQMLKLFNHHG